MTTQWPVSIAANHYQLSYRIVESGGATQHTVITLGNVLRQAGERVKDVVWTGWSMFHQFSGEEIAPRIAIDRAYGDEVEALEVSLLGKTTLNTTLPDYWRVTVDGRATIVRPYREDREEILHLKHKGFVPGNWFSPRTLAQELYEFVTHAKEMAKSYEFAYEVEFLGSWYGLNARYIADFKPGVSWREHKSHTNERRVSKAFSIEDVVADTCTVVSEMANPVLRLFDGMEITPAWIEKERPNFRSI